jgi:dihydrofolate reductase
VATVIAGMAMSLDGFVADAHGDISRLHTDLRGTDYMNAWIERTGAVLMGRRTFEMGEPDSYVGNYEFQVPIFVLTHHPPKTPPKKTEVQELGQSTSLTLRVVRQGQES